MNTIRFFVITTSLMLLTACQSVERLSSAQMKEELLASHLFKSAHNFYPDKEQISMVGIYPKLENKQITQINRELSALLSAVQELNKKRYSNINKRFGGNLQEFAKSRLVVTNANVEQPIAEVNYEDNTIEINIKVAQALFRGAILDYCDNVDSSFRSDFIDSSGIDEQDLDREQKLIIKLIEKIEEIENTPAHTIVGDMSSMVSSDDYDDIPWFYFSGVLMASQEIKNRYKGASLFLVAHEYGHIVLSHGEKWVDAKEVYDEHSICEVKTQLELEADAYAVVLLSNIGGPIPLNMFGLDKLTGYENFFNYVYKLAGYNEGTNSQECAYPSKYLRMSKLKLIENAIGDKKNEALQGEINRFFDRQIGNYNLNGGQ